MKAINIYILTRITKPVFIQKLERQMSGRRHSLPVKEWEVDGMRQFIEQLIQVLPQATSYEFYYSFQLPKLGKEFDLLRISEEYVVNVELKSGNVSDEAIRKQLLQNRHYLAMLGRITYSYTYISNQNRLVRLSNSGKLVEATWEKLREDLLKQQECFCGEIESLFKEDKYLISPLAEPDKFLQQEYFLTYQQRDIRKQILMKVSQGHCCYQCFTGLPGTGKTLLLYDIAMQLSWRDRVCILHFGTWSKELEQLDQRLKRIDFIHCSGEEPIKLAGEYRALCIDEGHRIRQQDMAYITAFAEANDIPVIISYDLEEALAPQERCGNGGEVIESLEHFTKYRITNRIRINSEISSFIHSLVHSRRANHREHYPSVRIAYANDGRETEFFLKQFVEEGYVYVRDPRVGNLCMQDVCGVDAYKEDIGDTCGRDIRDAGAGDAYKEDIGDICGRDIRDAGAGDVCMGESDNFADFGKSIDVMQAACLDFEKVVMLVDKSFSYNEEGYLVSDVIGDTNSKVRCLFHGLNRAKREIALVVQENEQVFEGVLRILQR